MCDFKGHKCKDAVWRSIITEEMVGHLTEVEQERLFESLDNAVAIICDDFDVKG